MMKTTIQLTMAQALIRFLANQYVEIDSNKSKFVHGIMGIFGHGNVTGLGEALENDSCGLRFYQGHNEQGMAHAATAYAKQKNRLAIIACTSSIGPGATNMITAAATAKTNRIPLLLLPGDIFSCKQPDPVLQQLEQNHHGDSSVNDCFREVSNYWARINRPEQLMASCLQAMRVLTNPAETGAVTLCLPQDVQTEAYEYPLSFFDERVWTIDRQPVSQTALERAVACLKAAKKPLIIAGGGVHYSLATGALLNFINKHKIPMTETQAGKSAVPSRHPLNLGGIGVTGTLAANRLAEDCDCLLVLGSRLQDFTTASKTAFKNPDLKVIALNVCSMDSIKLNALPLLGDIHCGLEQLSEALSDYTTSEAYQLRIADEKETWNRELEKVQARTCLNNQSLKQTAVLGLINELSSPEDVIICAAGSLPGDLHRLWESKAPKDYHLEYAYSCMGYEVAAGFGVRLAKGNSAGEVYVLVGDGSYLMMHSELITAIQENLKMTIVLFNNHGYQCIHGLQKANGSKGFGNEFRHRDEESGELSGSRMKIDFCKYAQALGAMTYYADTYEKIQDAIQSSKTQERCVLIEIPVHPESMSHGYNTFWRVDAAKVSRSEKVAEVSAAKLQNLPY